MFYRRMILMCFLIMISPLNVYAISDERTQLAVWTNESIVATYTYNYKDFLARQREIATYFTAAAWIEYSKAFAKSKLLESVQKNSYDVSAVATMPPEIETIREGYWRAKMPLLVVYKNEHYQQKQYLEITLIFIRAKSGEGVRGFAITSLQTKEVTPVCKCPK